MNTPVSLHGHLRAQGQHIVDQEGRITVLRGMSLFWSQMGGRFYNPDCISWLATDWGCSVIRAAMGVELGGYLKNPRAETERVLRVIEACIQQGIYVIVDWHDHHAENHTDQALEFFDLVSSRYGTVPNIIYEIYNEPLKVSWEYTIKPYAQKVIAGIRAHDPAHLILVGTPNWGQDVDDVIQAPLADDNVAYTLHFYTGTHHQSFRNKAQKAIDHGIPLFVSEYGLSEANGNGPLGLEDAREWYSFMNRNNLSRCAWAVSDMKESSASLLPSAGSRGNWTSDDMSPCGKALRDELLAPLAVLCS